MSISLEILATTLGMRLAPDELEWLSMALKERAEQRRREAGSESPHAGRLPARMGNGKAQRA